MKFKYILIVLFALTISINAQNKTKKSNTSNSDNLNNVYQQIEAKFDNTNNSQDFWLITDNIELEYEILKNGNKSEYDKFNNDLNFAIKEVNLEIYLMLKSYFPNNIDKNKLRSFFKNSDIKSKLNSIINNTIVKFQFKEQFEEIIKDINLNVGSVNYTKLNSIYNDIESNDSNKADIDAVMKSNSEKEKRAQSMYEESLKKKQFLDELNASLEATNKARKALDPSYTGPGISTSGVSVDSPYFKGPSPTPIYQPPKLDAIPETKRAKISMTAQILGNGNHIIFDYIKNTILNHYLILF